MSQNEQSRGGRLTLYESRWFTLDKRPGDVVLQLRRTAEPADAKHAARETEALTRALKGLDRARHGLLLDLRAVPLNTSPGFDKATERFRAEVFAGFGALVTLTSTSLGRLQASRLRREEKRDGAVVQGELEAAEEELRQALAARRSGR
jgi:hypothetical protein